MSPLSWVTFYQNRFNLTLSQNNYTFFGLRLDTWAKSIYNYCGLHRGVAQLVERRSPKPVVAGSSPVSPANKVYQPETTGFYFLFFNFKTSRCDYSDSRKEYIENVVQSTGRSI